MAVTGLCNLCANRASTRIQLQRKPVESKSMRLRSDGIEGGRKSPKHELAGRRVMVVADSNKEAKDALQWCLSHAVQKNDTLVLLHVVTPSKIGDSFGRLLPSRRHKHLIDMENTCKSRRPELKVEALVVQGGQRGPAIVEAAEREKVSLLVLGQQRRMLTWRVLTSWARNRSRRRGSVLEHCIQNASCMTLGVRRKGCQSGGFLITTKKHKNFWLLA